MAVVPKSTGSQPSFRRASGASSFAPELQAFREASQRAERDFLMRFRDISARVNGVPAQDEAQDPHQAVALRPAGPQPKPPTKSSSLNTAFHERSRTLWGAVAVGGAVGGAAAYLAFTEAVALGTAPLGATVPQLPQVLRLHSTA